LAVLLASDMHLRPDQPERGERFARRLAECGPADELILVGDVCDFWFASRRRRGDEARCPGLRAIREFRRSGARLTILPGNHDNWLMPFYRDYLDADVDEAEHVDRTIEGLRVRLAHGHRLGAGGRFKAVMEGRGFLTGFGLLPGPLARGLEGALEARNAARLPRSNARNLEAFRRAAEATGDAYDLVVFGHLHLPIDEPAGRTRLVVLGGWFRASPFLRIEDGRATHDVRPEGEDRLASTARPALP
jgi:UDP-2,3-diacylglucosamine hydrolase